MRFGRRFHERVGAVVLAAVVGGCASPPAVMPLMQSARQAMQEERRLLEEDAERHRAHFEQQREAIADGFEADLERRESLDPAWVMQGVRAYTMAREQLLRQELELRRQVEQRRRNLNHASAALDRAAGLLRQRDRLLGEVMPSDASLWEVTDPQRGNGSVLIGDSEEEER